ncbi:hypothetical protein ESZ53_06010 [Salinibacterium sp. UTAS2018]|uniref:hypothetical protein n=1 Tax=Salinibacterium sp. UTAS2018 TaxID=2508880 RepID=UPI0010093FF8|nr:hypothetical protein [Salinibacterium sp. UTAS2018]QAV70026.1 hypothetical protein ESZ53_06010 [Salinibacterium sp. UTAS2018]
MDDISPASSPEDAAPAKTSLLRTRIRQLTTPWWRLAWLIGGLAWAVVFNVVYVTTGGTQEWWGIVSVVPIALLLLDLLRLERLERAAEQKRQAELKKRG